MNSQNLHTMISSAKTVIGEAEDNDYIIQPTKHAAKFEKNAPSLAAVLRSSQIKVVAQQYEEADNIAIKAQENFKQTANRANWGVFLTAVFGVGIITVSALFPTNGGGGKPIFFIVLGLAGVLIGGLSAKWLFMIRRGNLLEEWMRSRAEAETYRIRYFKLTTNFQPDNNSESEIPLPLLQLEFFRRYQLDVQLNFYKIRAEEHKKAAHTTLSVEGWAIFLSAIATGLAGFSAMLEPRLASIAAIGIIGTSLGLLASTKEQLSQDRRNAERYFRTYKSLQAVMTKLDDVRKAVATHLYEPLQTFVAAVHEQLSLEHRQWTEEAKDINMAFEKLSEALVEYQSTLETQMKSEEARPQESC